jgi:hypothetical protein
MLVSYINFCIAASLITRHAPQLFIIQLNVWTIIRLDWEAPLLKADDLDNMSFLILCLSAYLRVFTLIRRETAAEPGSRLALTMTVAEGLAAYSSAGAKHRANA